MEPRKMTTLQDCLDHRMTRKEIAEKLGLNYSTLRGQLRRANADPVKELNLSIEEKARRMDPDDAVDYLLFVIQCLNDAMANGAYHPGVDGLGLKLTSVARRILICLWDADGDIMSRKELHSASIVGHVDVTSETRSIDTQLVQIRKSISGTRYRIENVRAVGWRLVKITPE
jgi:DNA-binding response OmpR family regulator